MSVEQGWPGLAQYTPAVPADWSPIPRTVQDALDELGGRSPGTSGETSFVYRPGGGSSPGVYTTAAALLAAVDSSDTAQNKVISVDASLVGGTAVINNGPWPDNITWQSGKGSVLAVLELDEGTTFAGLTYRFRNIAVAPHNTAVIWTIGAGTSANLVLDQGAVLAPSGAGHVFADIAGTLSMSQFESVVGDGSAGHELFEVEATGSLQVLAFDGSGFLANTSKQGAAPGGTFNLSFDGASQSGISPTQVPVPNLLNFDPQPTFVFRPAAPSIPGSNVFTDWADLMASVALSPGTKTILYDDSFAATHVPAGTWNVDGCTFVPNFNTLGSGNLIFDNGAVLDFNQIVLDQGAAFVQSGNAPVFTPAAGSFALIELVDASISSSVAHPFARVNAAGADLIVLLFNSSGLGDGTNPVIQSDVGTCVVQLHGGTPVGVTVEAHALSGAGTTTIQIANNSVIVGYPQDVTTLNVTQPGLNQAEGFLAASSGAVATLTQTASNLSKKRTGKVEVDGFVGGSNSAGATITVQLLRDATVIATYPPIVQAIAGNWAASLRITDQIPDTAAHAYGIKVTPSAGTVTIVGNASKTLSNMFVQAKEQ